MYPLFQSKLEHDLSMCRMTVDNFTVVFVVKDDIVAVIRVLYSDTQKIIADRINKIEQERVFHSRFNLKSIQYDKIVPYYLIISDDSSELLPQREEFYIDILFAVEEFNFFD